MRPCRATQLHSADLGCARGQARGQRLRPHERRRAESHANGAGTSHGRPGQERPASLLPQLHGLRSGFHRHGRRLRQPVARRRRASPPRRRSHARRCSRPGQHSRAKPPQRLNLWHTSTRRRSRRAAACPLGTHRPRVQARRSCAAQRAHQQRGACRRRRQVPRFFQRVSHHAHRQAGRPSSL